MTDKYTPPYSLNLDFYCYCGEDIPITDMREEDNTNTKHCRNCGQGWKMTLLIEPLNGEDEMKEFIVNFESLRNRLLRLDWS